ncbi:hypothetical protein ADK64_29270 [Streptomyces sp. MMG1121]|nr:hypothetical protein ADK64_29270 [Streptomyces sp. MMG1121]
MPTRRTVLAGTAAATALPGLPAEAHADPAPAPQGYRRRTAVIGRTGFVTGVLFHPATPGLACARTGSGDAYRWDDPADPAVSYAHDTDTGPGTPCAGSDGGRTFAARATGLPAGDGQFQLAVAATGDPRTHGRVYLATNGRGIQYGEPV